MSEYLKFFKDSENKFTCDMLTMKILLKHHGDHVMVFNVRPGNSLMDEQPESDFIEAYPLARKKKKKRPRHREEGYMSQAKYR